MIAIILAGIALVLSVCALYEAHGVGVAAGSTFERADDLLAAHEYRLERLEQQHAFFHKPMCELDPAALADVDEFELFVDDEEDKT